MQNYTKFSVRSSVILTTDYVAGTTIGVYSTTALSNRIHDRNQLLVYLSLTIGSLTSVQLKVEFSDDDTTYYQETGSTISAGLSADDLLVHEFTATGNYRLATNIKDKYVKISIKGTGDTTNSLALIDAIIGQT